MEAHAIIFDLAWEDVTIRSIKLIAFPLVALLWTVACSPQSANNNAANNSAQPQTLSVGMTVWPGYSGYHVAVKKGFYEQAGLKIPDILFQSTTEEITAFLSGKLALADSLVKSL